MGRGLYLTADLRQGVVHAVFTLKLDLKEAYAHVFLGSAVEYTYGSFKKLVQSLKRMSEDEISMFCDGPVSRFVAGRKRIYSNEVRVEVVNLRLRYSTAKFEKLRDIFRQHYTNQDDSVPSKATLSRWFEKANLTQKVTELRNVRVDPAAQLTYLLTVASIHPMNLIDVDETLCTADEFHCKYGWSPSGEKATYIQICIGGVAYSTIAAYSILGFLCWSIYEGSVTGVEMQEYLYNDLQQCVAPTSHIILDNASIHKTVEVTQALSIVCPDRYTYCAPYSPKLKPIELGFANIKRWLREHEADAVLNPILFINHAFHLYSVHGEKSAAGNFLYCVCYYSS